METQKIENLLDDVDNESSKFATRKWYVINDQNNTNYDEGNEDSTTVKFETNSDAYILVTGNITLTGGYTNNRVSFKKCAPFTNSITHINNEHVDNANNLDFIMLMYSLIEYSDNYSGIIILWLFKIDEQNLNYGNLANVTADDSTSFKYKSSFLNH